MKHIVKVNNIQDAKDSAIRPIIAMDSNGILFFEGLYILPKPSNNEICYRTTLGEAVEPNTDTLLGENGTVLHIISNNFEPSWKGYRMVLDGDLVKIGDDAFYKQCQFTDIRFPDTLERICYRAFRQCSDQWMTIDFGSGIKYIDDQAFHADKIKNLVFPTSLISVGEAFWYSGISNDDGILRLPAGISYGHMFANAWAFDTLLFEEGITEIGALFNGNQSSDVKHVILPATLRIIGDQTFGCNPLLTEINLPTGLQSIGGAAFRDCSGLTSVTIPDSVTSIGDWAFLGCTGLTSVTIGNSVTSIGECAFNSCSGLTTISIPSSVTNISREYVFTGTINIQSISVASSNPTYDSRNNCNAIIETSTNKLIVGNIDITTIPDTVTIIGYASFAMDDKNTRTNSVDIPASVTTIEKWAFEAIPTLTTITCRATNPPTLDALAFEGSSNIAHIYVPAESVETYKAATNWSTFANIIEAIPVE